MSLFWCLLFVWLFFLPITYAIPLFWLEKRYFHNRYQDSDAEAIVILGAGLTNSSTMMQPNLTIHLLERVRFGAFLQRKTQLPILVTGDGSHSNYSEAEVMKQVLEEEFHAHVDFVEDKSHSTIENVTLTAKMLREQGIASVFLVTSSWHLRRSALIFKHCAKDIKVTPIANFAYASKTFKFDKRDFIPSLATPYYQRRFYREVAYWVGVKLLAYKGKLCSL